MNRELPIYKMVIGDEMTAGVDFVALVDEPAIQKTWQVFENKRELFKTDNDRQIISGALMVADLPIYRRDNERGEYYVTFDQASIEKIQHKFMLNGYTKNFNIMHNADQKANGVYLFNTFLIDTTLGINTPEGYDELPNGSWFGSVKVTDKDLWDNYIKKGIFKGFSVEGYFDLIFQKDEKEKDIIKQIKEILEA